MKRFSCIIAFTFCMLATGSALAQDGSGIDETRDARRAVDWEARLANAVPRAHQPLYLVVHSATDCKFCQRWKGPFGGKGEFEKWAKDYPLAHLVIIERSNIDGTETEALYPVELALLSSTSAVKTERCGPVFRFSKRPSASASCIEPMASRPGRDRCSRL